MGVTKIQWCDYTFNPWMGCRKVAPECTNCYIVETPPLKFRGLVHGSERIRTSASNWKQPLAWDRAVTRRDLQGYRKDEEIMERPRVFCLSLGDWLDDEVPRFWLADLLMLIHKTPNLIWLLLTKRPENFETRVGAFADGYLALGLSGEFTETGKVFGDWIADWRRGTPPGNVWIGVSAGADQAAALEIPAKIHFLSCEPMLHPMDTEHAARFDWIIFGGESGTKARECSIDWIRQGVKFCRDSRAAPFVKQMGSKCVTLDRTTHPAKIAFKDSHGGDMDEWPEDLRVREFPL